MSCNLIWTFKLSDIFRLEPGKMLLSKKSGDTECCGVHYKWKFGFDKLCHYEEYFRIDPFIALVDTDDKNNRVDSRIGLTISTTGTTTYAGLNCSSFSGLIRHKLCTSDKLLERQRLFSCHVQQTSSYVFNIESDFVVVLVVLTICQNRDSIESLKPPPLMSGKSAGDRFFQDLFDMIHVKKEESNDYVTVISSDGLEFECSRKILSMQSTVFEAMFNEKKYLENETNRVEAKDVDGETLNEILRFVYTETVDEQKLEQLAPKCLHAAEKYNLAPFIEYCSYILRKQLKFDNAAEILLVADRYNAADLKKSAVDFIIANYKDVSQIDSWKNIKENNALMQDLLNNTMGRLNGKK